jgi:DNA-binding LytR/AlgR family response regulator
MINILIIEDEVPARNKLKRFLEALATKTSILAEIDNVEEAVTFLKTNKPDLIFSDIELLDGNAFEIYNQVAVSCPIIFITAYNQFLMDAFESNGIAYLLKPFSQERFQKAWDKFLLFKNTGEGENTILKNLSKLVEASILEKSYKQRFTISNHQGIYFLDTENVSYFEASEGVIFAFDIFGKKHLLNETTLKQIEEQVNPADFFRINRGELIRKQQVEKMERYTKNTLAVKMKGHQNLLKTSQSNTSLFREWIEK